MNTTSTTYFFIGIIVWLRNLFPNHVTLGYSGQVSSITAPSQPKSCQWNWLTVESCQWNLGIFNDFCEIGGC